jgi:hypothetical protein
MQRVTLATLLLAALLAAAAAAAAASPCGIFVSTDDSSCVEANRVLSKWSLHRAASVHILSSKE